MTVSQPLARPAEPAVHQQIQDFYGRQMRLLDAGDAGGWAATFTEDGVFAANGHPEPQRGRAVIESKARDAAAALAARGEQRRHWLGMLSVDDAGDGTFHAHTYALIIATPRGGTPAPALSCTCDDVLVATDGGWRVRHRSVLRDDLPR